MKLRYSLVLGIASTIAGPLSAEWTSGGGSADVFDHNPWFVAADVETAADYCIDIAPERLSIAPEIVREQVKLAMTEWQEALDILPIKFTYQPFLDGEKKTLVRKWRYTDTCSDETSLKIMIGSLDDQVEEKLARSRHGFVGFADRRQYNVETGWSRGVVWISPDRGPHAIFPGADVWSLPSLMRAILHHEIGHVVGLQHSDNFHLMASGMPIGLLTKAAAGRIPPEEFEMGMAQNVVMMAVSQFMTQRAGTTVEPVCSDVSRFEPMPISCDHPICQDRPSYCHQNDGQQSCVIDNWRWGADRVVIKQLASKFDLTRAVYRDPNPWVQVQMCVTNVAGNSHEHPPIQLQMQRVDLETRATSVIETVPLADEDLRMEGGGHAMVSVKHFSGGRRRSDITSASLVTSWRRTGRVRVGGYPVMFEIYRGDVKFTVLADNLFEQAGFFRRFRDF